MKSFKVIRSLSLLSLLLLTSCKEEVSYTTFHSRVSQAEENIYDQALFVGALTVVNNNRSDTYNFNTELIYQNTYWGRKDGKDINGYQYQIISKKGVDYKDSESPIESKYYIDFNKYSIIRTNVEEMMTYEFNQYGLLTLMQGKLTENDKTYQADITITYSKS